MAKVVAVVSGGMDSVTLLYQLLNEGHAVYAISFDYGQRHRKELDALAGIVRLLKDAHAPLVEWKVADLSGVGASFLYGSSQTSKEVAVPHGHYAEESMKVTVVPNRNMVMLSVAVGWAVALKAKEVHFGAHAGDHAIYPDCRHEFVAALAAAVRLCDWGSVLLLAPFLTMDKAQIAALGHTLGVPFDLTWSCYEGKELHCGKCGTCVERREAFQKAGVPDPTTYAEERKPNYFEGA